MIRQEVPLDTPVQPSSSFMQTDMPKAGDTVATIETNFGTIKLRLFPELVPETVKNFTELAKKGYYDGLTFHRVINDFMIQGGDPDGTGAGGESYKGPGTVIPDEFSDKLKNIRGALSMANRGPNTGSSQFFIVQKSDGTPWLDGLHAVFGQVFEGMDVVDKIAALDKGDGTPSKKIIMKSVKIGKF